MGKTRTKVCCDGKIICIFEASSLLRHGSCELESVVGFGVKGATAVLTSAAWERRRMFVLVFDLAWSAKSLLLLVSNYNTRLGRRRGLFSWNPQLHDKQTCLLEHFICRSGVHKMWREILAQLLCFGRERHP